jgi:AAA family ATP:ADP antiporter
MSAAVVTGPRPGLRSLVAAGEGRALLAAALAFFCLLCGYYMLRPLRDAMALEVGREWNAALFGAVFVVQLCMLPAYWWIVARVTRRRLPFVVYGAAVAVFAAVASGYQFTAASRGFAAAYFVAVTSLNLFMVSVFWSVMADYWHPEAAKRLFGFVAAGGSVGALVGPVLMPPVIRWGGPGLVIASACALFGGTIHFLGQARAARAGAHGPRDPARVAATAVGGRAIDDLARLVKSPYLLAIIGLIVVAQILGIFMYNEQARYVEATWSNLRDRAVLFSRVEFGVNLLSLFLQSVVVGWLTARMSLRASLSAMPALAGLSFLALALVPEGRVVLATQILRRGLEYGLGKPTREMLFTVLNPESKFKSKSLIDTVVQRGADTLGQTIALGMTSLTLTMLGWLSAAVCLVLIGVTTWLGSVFEARRASMPLQSVA